MKDKSKNPLLLVFGIFNVIYAILFIFIDMVVAFTFFLDVKNYISSFVMYAIIFFSPLSCIVGIVQGRRCRERNVFATACFILSIIGLLLFAVVMGFIYWAVFG